MIFLRDFVVSPVLGDFAFFAVSRHFPYLGTLNDLYGKLRQGGHKYGKHLDVPYQVQHYYGFIFL